MTVQQEFINFNDRIKLSRRDDAYTKARTKDDSITSAIKDAFKEEGYKVIDDFLQGSLSTDTGVLKKDGDFDIDRALVIDEDDAPENPVDPKKVVLRVLEKRGFKNAKIKKPCITADYLSENLHIDFTVYRRFGESTYQLAIGKYNSDENNREWSGSDPKGLKSWIKNNSTYGASAGLKQNQFNRMVRYLKRWRDEQFSEDVGRKIFSIALTVMAKQSFTPSLTPEGQPNDLEALKETVSKILEYGYFTPCGTKYGVQVDLPVVPYIDIFTGSSLNTGTQLRNKLVTLRDKLVQVSEEADLVKQCTILNKLFGEDFHIPEPKKSHNTTKRVTYATAGAVGTSQGA